MGALINVLFDEGAERILCRQVFETYMRDRGWDVTPNTNAYHDGIPIYSYKKTEVDNHWLWWQSGWLERAKL